MRQLARVGPQVIKDRSMMSMRKEVLESGITRPSRLPLLAVVGWRFWHIGITGIKTIKDHTFGVTPARVHLPRLPEQGRP